METQRFRKFTIWIKAMSFIEEIYKITAKFPANEIYGLTSQIRRAATSVALNIAEGSGADSDNEFHRFLNISRRSVFEVICGLEIAQRINYVSEKEIQCLFRQCDELSAMASGFKKQLKPKQAEDSSKLKAQSSQLKADD